jgi:hypothetical protein
MYAHFYTPSCPVLARILSTNGGQATRLPSTGLYFISCGKPHMLSYLQYVKCAPNFFDEGFFNAHQSRDNKTSGN